MKISKVFFVLFLLALFLTGCVCKSEVYCACPVMLENATEQGSVIDWQKCQCNDNNPDQKVLLKCIADMS